MARVKKRWIFLLMCLLLLTGCNRAPAPSDEEFEASCAAVAEALGGQERFALADEDFVQTAFSPKNAPLHARVCFEKEGCGEWGLFFVSDTAEAKALESALRAYLAQEKEAVESLAELYPARELEQRLALYTDAEVGCHQGYVWYFALSPADRTAAMRALYHE